MDRINEIQARLAEINTQLDTAEGEALTALETESRTLLAELQTLQNTAQARQQLRQQIAAGAGNPVGNGNPNPAQQSAEERAAATFTQTNRMTIGAEQSRAALISSGTLATPTKVDGINDIVGAKVSSIIDLVKIVNCVGMGSHRVAYVATDAAAAGTQTEGSAATEGGATYAFVDIKPESVAVVDYISKQAKKQTPLQYSSKVREQALIALRKKAAAIVTAALTASQLTTVATGSGAAIGAATLRNIALSYGGDESVVGGAVLFLNKTDLLAFGDVRGTHEKKALYEITPDTANPNTGTIKEGGLSVRYCINSNLAAGTMYYGNPQALELDLFSDYEIKVSEDYAIIKLMETIVGDVELGADVVVQGGFVKYATA